MYGYCREKFYVNHFLNAFPEFIVSVTIQKLQKKTKRCKSMGGVLSNTIQDMWSFFHSRAQAEFAFVEFSKTIRKTNQITLFCNFFIQFKQACANSVGFLPQVKMT